MGERAEINKETKFSQAEYKVTASPRVTEKKKVKKGGGRYIVGKEYRVRGKTYRPKEDPSYSAVGIASWYGPNFHGRLTANGEIFDQYALSAAHPTMPLPSYARVTNLGNGSSVIVRVNDRGPFAHNRVIDLSARAAQMLGYAGNGTAKVRVEYVGKARMDGHDEKFLMASYRGPGFPNFAPGATQPGTLLAMAKDPIAKPVPAKQVLEDRIQLALVGDIPVPTERPVTYDGLPMAVIDDSQPFQTASLQPLGFRSEDALSLRFASAFEAIDRSPTVRIESTGGVEATGKAVFVRLGRFSDGEHAEYVRRSFADLGMISLRRVVAAGTPVWEVRLLAAGDVADDVLRIVHERGLTRAKLISG
jgi:rare lipoprotein A (peptidoglycan hydrolase)